MRASAASEHPLDRLVRRLFGHRHKWRRYELVGNGGRTVFRCRECECGADEVLWWNGEWKDRSIPFVHSYENDWIRYAKRVPPNA